MISVSMSVNIYHITPSVSKVDYENLYENILLKVIISNYLLYQYVCSLDLFLF